ncbi:hypothetical protein F183_A15860 [Bryobacterales bacterium F-183]|nr:hypothetical protein F183_A15860 [Bryobacterales bacterium F-183]
MPILADYIKPPRVLTPAGFVPAGGFSYKVVTGDSWKSLAARSSVAPWDLIRFNYPNLPRDEREAVKEVNWYLQNRVGCTTLTSDFRSYHFNSLDSPGTIYLPNSVIQTEIAKQRIVRILTNSYTAGILFSAGPRLILGSYYLAVAEAVQSGRIAVKLDPSVGHMAYYDYSVPGGTARGQFRVSATTSESLIVHEATHAVFDFLKATIANNQNEAIAYIAQHVYDRRKYGPPKGRYTVSRDPADPVSEMAWQLIFDEASRLAGLAVSQTWIPIEECILLYSMLPVANSYRAKGTTVYTYDGI